MVAKGTREPGVAGDDFTEAADRHPDRQRHRHRCARARQILEPAGLTMVLEPLSDNPDLFLRTSDQAYAICRAVDSPACKILYDMYHMQRNEGDIMAHIDHAWSEIAYFQIGDNPGRKEPGTGEMNYQQPVPAHPRRRDYDGVFGMEHGNSLPGKEGELALIDAYVAADSFEVRAK